jgi:predicted signal transduction protein with EAL and GGDEF domain
MPLSLSLRALKRRVATLVRPPRDAGFDAVLLREQYSSLVRFAPYLYGVVIAGAVMMCVAMRNLTPPLYTIVIPACGVTPGSARCSRPR